MTTTERALSGPSHCENCGSILRQRQFEWLFECETCSLLVSTLEPYKDPDAVSGYAADDHSTAFGTLREENAEITLAMLSGLAGAAGRDMLEVGSAQGFFLKAAEQRGFTCTGIEPNRQLRQSTSNSGLNVMEGFFPEALPEQKTFDHIVFNDVIEHIPDIGNTLACCHRHLGVGGVLTINVPMRKGIFYAIGDIGMMFGWKKPLERLWQVGTMSPHLYYFNERNLADLATRAGFEFVTSKRLKTITLTGLWQRLRVTSNFGFITACGIWAGTVVLSPFLAFLPADSRVFAFRKRAS